MNSFNCLGVIPARYDSQRLPGKPLEEIGGKSLLQRVWEQCIQTRSLVRVIIATDDPRIEASAKQFGADVLMTSSDHASGSDRVAEVVEQCGRQGSIFDLVANIQGDMPFIAPQIIDKIIEKLHQAGQTCGMGTLATPIYSQEEFHNPSVVKVVMSDDQQALYFSRAPIPYTRKDGDQAADSNDPLCHQHIGLYVFRPDVLTQFTSLAPAKLEAQERLEQLRALANGIGIAVAIAPPEVRSSLIEVNTAEDLEKARAYCSGNL